MASNAQKTPMVRTLASLSTRRVMDVIQTLGKSLNCSVVSVDGPIITVKFEVTSDYTLPNVSVPIFGPEYIRYPIKPGCKGVVFPVDVRVAPIAGQSKGTANLSQPANLSSLVFFPIGNKGWSTTPDPSALVLYGETSVIIQSKLGTVVLQVGDDGISMTVPPGKTIGMAGNGAGFSFNANGDLLVTPKAGQNVYLGGESGSKKVVLDGDPVSGGAVHSTSTNVKST